MCPVATRAPREIVNVPGMGGHIEAYTPSVGDLVGVGTMKHAGRAGDGRGGGYLEIGKWIMNHRYINADVTHSGSNGAILRKKVAQDYTFHLEIPWNAIFHAIRTNPAASYGFLDTMMAGILATDFVASVKFNLGDAAFWSTDYAAYYYAPKAKLENVRTITDSTGTEIVRIEVEGSGTSLLRGYLGDDTWQFGGADTEFDTPVPAYAGP